MVFLFRSNMIFNHEFSSPTRPKKTTLALSKKLEAFSLGTEYTACLSVTWRWGDPILIWLGLWVPKLKRWKMTMKPADFK